MKAKDYIKKRLKQFVVENIDDYQKIFNEFDQHKRKIIINFDVLFFGSLWFFYRKMFVLGSPILLLPIIAFWLILDLNADFLMFYFPIYFLSRIGLAFFANKIYWMKWKSYLSQTKPSFLLKMSEGVSYFAPIIVCIILIIHIVQVYEFLLQGMRH